MASVASGVNAAVVLCNIPLRGWAHYPSIKSPLRAPIAYDGKYRRLRRCGVYSALDEAEYCGWQTVDSNLNPYPAHVFIPSCLRPFLRRLSMDFLFPADRETLMNSTGDFIQLCASSNQNGLAPGQGILMLSHIQFTFSFSLCLFRFCCSLLSSIARFVTR